MKKNHMFTIGVTENELSYGNTYHLITVRIYAPGRYWHPSDGDRYYFNDNPIITFQWAAHGGQYGGFMERDVSLSTHDPDRHLDLAASFLRSFKTARTKAGHQFGLASLLAYLKHIKAPRYVHDQRVPGRAIPIAAVPPADHILWIDKIPGNSGCTINAHAPDDEEMARAAVMKEMVSYAAASPGAATSLESWITAGKPIKACRDWSAPTILSIPDILALGDPEESESAA